ncbi:MAG: protein kinase, partial [Myxococcaceae bacterium]|nr:protein kinase [Myxococcaceae bacterium]
MSAKTSCTWCGNPLALGAVACFRCGRMVQASGPEVPQETYGVAPPTQLGTSARSTLLAGRWRLLDKLGQGAVGAVWHAHDVDLDRPVVVKRLHDALASSARSVERFEAHARALAAIEHPNLVPVLAIDRDGAVPFVVSKLVEGASLPAYLHQRGGRLSAQDAVALVLTLADVLATLHAQGALHRDLKPSNLMVDHHGQLQVLDVGLARDVGEATTRTGHLPGTAPYLSPEELSGQEVGPPSDLYSLGALAYELLSGAPPFVGEVQDVIAAHRERPAPPLPPGLVDAALAAVVARLLEKAPHARPASAAELALSLERAAGLSAGERRAVSAPVASREPVPVAGTGESLFGDGEALLVADTRISSVVPLPVEVGETVAALPPRSPRSTPAPASSPARARALAPTVPAAPA